jgi:6-phosphogluconolactonase
MVTMYPDLPSLTRAAADLIASRARDAVSKSGRFTIALSGGSTPRPIYELLAKPPLRDQVPWSLVHIFWGDERWVPHDDARSNYGAAKKSLLEHVPIPSTNVHPVQYLATPEQSAAAYDADLRRFFGRDPRFDLILLGMGADGHTASLFPTSPALNEQTKWAVAGPGPDVPRVTLTLPTLNEAATVAFLVAGADKAPSVRTVLNPTPGEPTLPAQLIRPTRGELLWLLDQPAASQIEP